jgi:hypothetical protein
MVREKPWNRLINSKGRIFCWCTARSLTVQSGRRSSRIYNIGASTWSPARCPLHPSLMMLGRRSGIWAPSTDHGGGWSFVRRRRDHTGRLGGGQCCRPSLDGSGGSGWGRNCRKHICTIAASLGAVHGACRPYRDSTVSHPPARQGPPVLVPDVELSKARTLAAAQVPTSATFLAAQIQGCPAWQQLPTWYQFHGTTKYSIRMRRR